MTTAGAAFGRRLREARERRGIALDAVSESTKIKTSLLAGLERGDVSAWPRGIFRRAFVREYARAIGLPPPAVLAEFSRLFPDGGDTCVQAPEARDLNSGLRMTLAADDRRFSRALVLRVAAALVDLSGLVVIGAAGSWIAGASPYLIAGVAGVIYFTIATACLGRSAAAWWLLAKGRDHAAASGARPPLHVTGVDRLQIVSRRGAPARRPSRESGSDRAADAPSAIAAGR
jgi:transcriptional regulator with XRE-family HTH domain